VVRIFQPVHGYDVRRELISWHAEEWANVAPGSIYNALKSLTRDGLLEVVGTKQVGGRPERTTYRLTSRGQVELNELLRDTLWTVRTPIDPFVAAISFMGFIARDELVKALDARATMIEASSKHAQYVVDAIDGVETPDHVREMIRLLDARMTAELAWSRALKARLLAGEYNTLGDPHWQPSTKPAPKPRRPAKRATRKAKR
jgi:DNA-binding PadR family transcriptional regulator